MTKDSIGASEAGNMDIWNRVATTDPKFTKNANNGRFDFTAIDPMYQTQEATKIWGPYGAEWGLRNLRFEMHHLGEQACVILEAEFFYPLDGKTVAFPIIVDDKFRPGQDTFKKLSTNARSKALSYLGFSADIFMGKFDDSAYVNDLKVKYGEQEAFMTRAIASIKAAKSKADVARCRERLDAVIANDTLPEEQWRTLLDLIIAKQSEFSE